MQSSHLVSTQDLELFSDDEIKIALTKIPKGRDTLLFKKGIVDAKLHFKTNPALPEIYNHDEQAYKNAFNLYFEKVKALKEVIQAPLEQQLENAEKFTPAPKAVMMENSLKDEKKEVSVQTDNTAHEADPLSSWSVTNVENMRFQFIFSEWEIWLENLPNSLDRHFYYLGCKGFQDFLIEHKKENSVITRNDVINWKNYLNNDLFTPFCNVEFNNKLIQGVINYEQYLLSQSHIHNNSLADNANDVAMEFEKSPEYPEFILPTPSANSLFPSHENYFHERSEHPSFEPEAKSPAQIGLSVSEPDAMPSGFYVATHRDESNDGDEEILSDSQNESLSAEEDQVEEVPSDSENKSSSGDEDQSEEIHSASDNESSSDEENQAEEMYSDSDDESSSDEENQAEEMYSDSDDESSSDEEDQAEEMLCEPIEMPVDARSKPSERLKKLCPKERSDKKISDTNSSCSAGLLKNIPRVSNVSEKMIHKLMQFSSYTEDENEFFIEFSHNTITSMYTAFANKAVYALFSSDHASKIKAVIPNFFFLYQEKAKLFSLLGDIKGNTLGQSNQIFNIFYTNKNKFSITKENLPIWINVIVPLLTDGVVSSKIADLDEEKIYLTLLKSIIYVIQNKIILKHSFSFDFMFLLFIKNNFKKNANNQYYFTLKLSNVLLFQKKNLNKIIFNVVRLYHDRIKTSDFYTKHQAAIKNNEIEVFFRHNNNFYINGDDFVFLHDVLFPLLVRDRSPSLEITVDTQSATNSSQTTRITRSNKRKHHAVSEEKSESSDESEDPSDQPKEISNKKTKLFPCPSIDSGVSDAIDSDTDDAERVSTIVSSLDRASTDLSKALNSAYKKNIDILIQQINSIEKDIKSLPIALISTVIKSKIKKIADDLCSLAEMRYYKLPNPCTMKDASNISLINDLFEQAKLFYYILVGSDNNDALSTELEESVKYIYQNLSNTHELRAEIHYRPQSHSYTDQVNMQFAFKDYQTASEYAKKIGSSSLNALRFKEWKVVINTNVKTEQGREKVRSLIAPVASFGDFVTDVLHKGLHQISRADLESWLKTIPLANQKAYQNAVEEYEKFRATYNESLFAKEPSLCGKRHVNLTASATSVSAASVVVAPSQSNTARPVLHYSDSSSDDSDSSSDSDDSEFVLQPEKKPSLWASETTFFRSPVSQPNAAAATNSAHKPYKR